MPELSNISFEELKKLLEENLKYTRETFKTVEKIRRHFMMERIYQFVKLVIVVGLLVVSYLTIQPYINQLMEAYGKIQGMADQAQNLNSNIYDQLKNIPQLKK